MNIIELIEKKRDGLELSKSEVDYFITAVTEGSIDDYQISAMLMAMYINDLSPKETIYLTEAMMNSGDIVDLSSIEGIPVDKHSTGGVGDKTSLVLGPLLASFGIPVAKMSGRALGHTGGTVDKLESIEGFSVELSEEDFIKQVNDIGLAIIAQTKNVAPADKKIYSLRDVTATVSNRGLIASSIMSKKLASGAKCIVLDIKVGSGAFLESEKEATELAKTMVHIGTKMNRNVRAVLTNMDEPLGYAIGNRLEVIEAMDTLEGHGPKDLTDLSVFLCANLLVMSHKYETLEDAIKASQLNLKNGKAMEKFREFVKAQGGKSLEFLPAKYSLEVLSNQEGYLHNMDTHKIGNLSANLGAGRKKIDDVIDFDAGIIVDKKIGDFVHVGDRLCTLYSSNPIDESLLQEYIDCLGFEKVAPKRNRLIKKMVYHV